MKRISLSIILLIGLTGSLFIGCQSSKSALEHGDYYQACTLAIKALRNSPKNKKASAALEQAYPLLVQTTKNNIDNLLTLNTPNKYRQTYNEYVKLNSVYQDIQACPAAMRILPSAQSFFSEQASMAKLALGEILADADAKLALGTHEDARQAYFLYGEALRFDPNSNLARSKQYEALDKAIVKVVLEQMPVVGMYQFSCNFFYDQIFTSLNNDRRSQFLQFYRPEEATRMNLVPDHVIRMSFDDFVVGQTIDKKVVEDMHKDSVVVGTVKLADGSVQNAYNTVYCKLTTNTRTVESKGLLAIQIMDYSTKTLLAHEKFPGTYVWGNSWGSFNGDSRALNAKQLGMCDRQAVMPPPAQDLFLEFTKPIFNNASYYLIQFYKNPRYAMQ